MASDASRLTARLAARVISHVKHCRLAPGAHLKEQELADLFRVSRSPVRNALALLAEQGVLTRESNRGYFLKSLPPEYVRRTLQRDADEAEEKYLRIADDRLAGRLEDQVTETALMRRYRMPRRELQRILHRMEKEGWIERKPGHGWMFVALANSVEAHAQSYRFRMLIEPAALLEPGFCINKSDLERVRRDQQMLLDGGFMKVSRARLFELGSDFHETIVGFSGNHFFAVALKRVNAMRRLLEYRAHVDRGQLIGQCREHLWLLDLLEQGSRQEAARYLRSHLDVVRAIKTEARRPAPRTAATLTAQF